MASTSKKLKSVGVDVGTIGIVGAIMLAIIEKKCTDEWREPLTITVPLASAIVANAVKWLWDVISPEHAETIKLRRCLKKQIKAIKQDLASPDLSEAYKVEKRKRLEQLSTDLIESHRYTAPDRS